MIPYGRQSIDEDDIQSVLNVFSSNWLTQGETVPRFEAALTSYTGAKEAVATNSATSALHIACLALGIGPGDKVWTSPNSFVASANAALYCGAEVDFVDIDNQTYNISVEHLASKLKASSKNGTLPKALIVVHFAGQSCDMETIYNLACLYGVKIIEDASHAIGGEYQNKPIGISCYSHITVFSFHPVKIITTGEGGAALTNDKTIADKMRSLRTHGIISEKQRFVCRPIDEIWNYQQSSLGYNYRMSDIHAALGVAQMRKIDIFVSRRRELANVYYEALKDTPFVLPWQSKQSVSSFHLFVIRVPCHLEMTSQRKIYQKLLENGVAANLHYIPIYRQPFYEHLGFKKGYCKNAELYYRETVTLPLFFGLRECDQSKVIRILTSCF